MKKQTAKIERFKLSQLREAGYNPRTISEEAYTALAKSIEKFGCVQPILINTKGGDNTIIGGNQRYKILLEKYGPDHECFCVTVRLSKADEKLLNITLNNPKCQGEFVRGLAVYIDELRKELEDKDDYFSLRIKELREEVGIVGKIGLTDDDAIPEPPAKPKTREGDLWVLDKHRLLCGSSTEMKDILTLMNGNKAKMCFTSPPYNMAAGMYEKYKDNLKSAAFINFNLIVACNVKKVLEGFLFWNMSYNTNARWEFIEVFYRLIKECGFTFLENIVWDKEKAMPITARTGLTRQYEDILLLTNQEIGHEVDFCFVGTTERTWAFDKRRQKGISNYWRIPVKDNTQLKDHKACFPTALPCKAIDLMSEQNDIILEPFCGSGTTVIAAEKLNRRCYAVELDPMYCDVAVKRWEQWTGRKARKQGRKGGTKGAKSAQKGTLRVKKRNRGK